MLTFSPDQSDAEKMVNGLCDGSTMSVSLDSAQVKLSDADG